MSSLPKLNIIRDVIEGRHLDSYANLVEYIQVFEKKLDTQSNYLYRVSDNRSEGINAPIVTAYRIIKATTHTDAIWFREYRGDFRIKRIYRDSVNHQFRNTIKKALDEYYHRKMRQLRMLNNNLRMTRIRASKAYFLLHNDDLTENITLNYDLLYGQHYGNDEVVEDDLYA